MSTLSTQWRWALTICYAMKYFHFFVKAVVIMSGYCLLLVWRLPGQHIFKDIFFCILRCTSYLKFLHIYYYYYYCITKRRKRPSKKVVFGWGRISHARHHKNLWRFMLLCIYRKKVDEIKFTFHLLLSEVKGHC